MLVVLSNQYLTADHLCDKKDSSFLNINVCKWEALYIQICNLSKDKLEVPSQLLNIKVPQY